MTDTEIREALNAGEVELEPLHDASLQPASYDLRLGDKAIITRRLEVDRLRERIEDDEPVPEIDVAKEGSISMPAGSFALIVTKERVRLSRRHAGHIGLRSYFARKGLLLLAGLQVDPGFEGHLVLGLANLSPRSVHIPYEEPIATLELHRLSEAASQAYSGTYAGQQVESKIPPADADYLRTIETLSVSDLTRALLGLSDNVATLTRDVRVLWIPIALAIVIAIILRVI
jgi:dCTP deaminase